MLISKDRLRVIDASSESVFDDEPLVALSEGEQRVILAIGTSARAEDANLINPFSHPRLVAHNFEVTEKLMQHAFRVVSNSKFIAPAPTVVLHVLGDIAGGITDLELRFLREAALGAGARETHVWQGPELSKQQLREGEFRHGAT